MCEGKPASKFVVADCISEQFFFLASKRLADGET
jgi:hypothetical protein